MKTTVVPAQVTTVEDKIAGNLGVSQLLLLTVPVFGGSALFVVLPPFFSYATYKVVLIVCMATLCGTLAIRIKGTILLLWAVIMLRYNLRPRYYVFDKNDACLREPEQDSTSTDVAEEHTEPARAETAPLPPLHTADIVNAESILTNPAAKFRMEINRKGELSVHITEVH